MQLSFITMHPASSTALAPSAVKGLRYIPNFLSQEQHLRLLNTIDTEYSGRWLDDLARRVQHYGFRYEYKSRKADSSTYLGPLPPFLVDLGMCLVREGYMPSMPNQAIVNEYLPGQGISAHIDCIPCFGPVIASISLGSSCVMDFLHKVDKHQAQIMLEPRSLLVFSEDSRYLWTHEIVGRRNDKVDGLTRPRERRVSITFRTVITDRKAVSGRSESRKGTQKA